jgi:DNA uptake protein ComE-like DNA-binding protein
MCPSRGVEEKLLKILNSGNIKQLLALSGIGKKRAELIIENRPFEKVLQSSPFSD